MRLAEIASPEKGRLRIPDAFGRMLGLYESSELFCFYVRESERPEMILTTIPLRSWGTIYRISVSLKHQSGSLGKVAQVLSSQRVNILLMEGYGYYSPKEGWWGAVIDFPELHSADEAKPPDKSKLQSELDELLKKLLPIFPGSSVYDRSSAGPKAKPFDLAGSALIGADGEWSVWIVPMELQKYVGKVTQMAQSRYIVRSNEIPLHTDGIPGARNMFMCNTEERFIRIGRIENPAEISLEVHTQGAVVSEVGVGILSVITGILTNYRPALCSSKDKGFNIAFTYNYITVPEEEEDSGTASETSRIELFLEMPRSLWGLEPEKQVEVWKEIFKKLLKAKRRGEEESFVKGESSRLFVWQKRIKGFTGDANGNVVPLNFRYYAVEWLTSRIRRKRRVLIFCCSLLGLAVCGVLNTRIKIPEPLWEAIITINILSLIAVIVPDLEG